MAARQMSVTGPIGSYNLLSNYNGKVEGAMGAPYLPPTTVVGSYIVPCYQPITYDSLTHGMAPTYAGYFNITDGYGKGANNCNTKFVSRLCSGTVNCGGEQPPMNPTMRPMAPTMAPTMRPMRPTMRPTMRPPMRQ